MSNRTLLTRWLATLVVMFLATACVQNLFDTRQGRVAITVKWPKKTAYSVMAIPENTAAIRVSIIGEGIDGDPLEVPELTPDGSEDTTEFFDVPIGPKTVQAVAYDADGKQLASGQKVINVLPNRVTAAHVIMQPEGEVPVDIGQVPPDPVASVPPEHIVSTVAGDGTPGAFDAGDPLMARFKYPGGMAFSGNSQDRALYVVDTEYRLIRRYDLQTMSVTTVAGTAPTSDVEPSPTASNAPALLGSGLGAPAGIAVDPTGQVYFTDRENHLIRKLRPGGGVITVAGSGMAGDKNAGTALQASFHTPVALAFDRFGAMYVADYLNHKIRRISVSGTVTTFAGTGAAGHSGDGGPALEAQINFPTAVAVDPAGEYLYLAEGRQPSIRRIHLASGQINTVAGDGEEHTRGAGGPALQAGLALPTALAFTAEGELLITEGWSLNLGAVWEDGLTSRLLKLTADGRLVRLAGRDNDAYDFTGDGGDARAAEFNNPMGVAVDDQGRIYVTDSYNNRLRMLTPYVAPVPTPAPSATPTATPSANPSAAASPL